MAKLVMDSQLKPIIYSMAKKMKNNGELSIETRA
jgi:hypothetical protein